MAISHSYVNVYQRVIILNQMTVTVIFHSMVMDGPSFRCLNSVKNADVFHRYVTHFTLPEGAFHGL